MTRPPGVGPAALVVAAGLAVHPPLAADRLAWLPAALGAAAVGLLAVGLAARWAAPLAWSLALLGAEYAAWLALRGGEVDARSPLYAAGLLVVADLAHDALDPGVARPTWELAARRALALAALALGAVALGAVALGAVALGAVVLGAVVLGAVVLAAAAIPVGGGVALTAAGAAATLALALVVRLARRRS